MGDSLIDKTLSHVVFGLVFWSYLAGEFHFSFYPVRQVRQQVVRIPSGHQACASESKRDPTGVAGDPAPSPLLGNIGSSAAAAGGIENKVTGIGAQKKTAFNYFC
jgi:hypothetical protein